MSARGQRGRRVGEARRVMSAMSLSGAEKQQREREDVETRLLISRAEAPKSRVDLLPHTDSTVTAWQARQSSSSWTLADLGGRNRSFAPPRRCQTDPNTFRLDPGFPPAQLLVSTARHAQLPLMSHTRHEDAAHAPRGRTDALRRVPVPPLLPELPRAVSSLVAFPRRPAPRSHRPRVESAASRSTCSTTLHEWRVA